jgi:RNA polymerase sigma-70 factor (ECF subfamily)
VRRLTFPKLVDVRENLRTNAENDFETLVEPLRNELHRHCYRLLGSVHDAEDALQEALLRAWRNYSDFEGRSSIRTWMYTICTRSSLDLARAKGRRALPADLSSPSSEAVPGDSPRSDVLWLSPYPSSDFTDHSDHEPSSRHEQREDLELAFVAALQHLPGNQRAALVLFDVVGFTAEEIATIMGTSINAVTSALARARKAASDRIPVMTQRATITSIGREQVDATVTEFAESIEARDINRLVAVLARDVTWSMPPLPHWYAGIRAITDFVERVPFGECGSWRHATVTANSQPAVALYQWDESSHAYVGYSISVLSMCADGISDITTFIGSEHYDAFHLAKSIS